MTIQCTDKRTNWNCKACGARLGNVSKDSRGWHYLTPSDKPLIRCYGDAEITCSSCGVVRRWYWNEYAMRKVLRYRIHRGLKNG